MLLLHGRAILARKEYYTTLVPQESQEGKVRFTNSHASLFMCPYPIISFDL